MRYVYLAVIVCTSLVLAKAEHAETRRHDDRCELSGFMGVHHSSPSREKVRRLGYDVYNGTLLTSIVGCSGAAEAGLQPLDYLVAVDGKEVDRDDSFFCLLDNAKPGETFTVDYFRAGVRKSTQLRIGSRSESCPDEKLFPKRGFFGLSGSDHDGKPGLLVDVSSGGPVAKLGMRDGDRLLRVNGYPVGDWSDISTVKRLISDIEDVTFDLVRDGRDLQLRGPIRADEHDGDSWAWMSGGKDCDDEALVYVNGQRIRREVEQAIADIDFDEIEREVENAIREANIQENTTNAVESAMEAVREALSRVRNGDTDVTVNDGSYERVDPSEMTTELEEVSEADIDRMRREKIDMPESTLVLADFTTSPNPSDGRFRLSFTFTGEGAKSVAIYSASGREVYSYELAEETRAFTDELDVMRNGPGSYFLVVRQGRQAFTKKLVFVRR